MIAAKALSFQTAEQKMTHSENTLDDGQVNAFDECQKGGVAFQVVAELIQGAEAFFRFGDKYGV